MVRNNDRDLDIYFRIKITNNDMYFTSFSPVGRLSWNIGKVKVVEAELEAEVGFEAEK
jgi:hypothetical protein